MPAGSTAKRAGRMARTIRSLLLMALLGGVLTIYSIYSNGRDVRLATGNQSEAQRSFFINASERPDIELFFRNLEPEERIAMAKNIGRYDDPEMAKLIGKCLGTFDASARVELTKSLAELAKTEPKAVAEQLSLAGSFQQLAVQSALKDAGPSILPIAAERLSDGASRPNAVAFLVSAGHDAVPALQPLLQDKEKDVRLAAADALGKLRAPESVQMLVQLYEGAEGDEKFGYLGALAGIGHPSTEPLLSEVLVDDSQPVPQRAQAALGLGRIASPSSTNLLWKYVTGEQPQLRQSAISALQTAGDVALNRPDAPSTDLLQVAAGIHTPRADAIIQRGLQSSTNRLVAAEAAKSRPTVVPSLVAALLQVDPTTDGDVADRLVYALSTTKEGLTELRSLDRPQLRGIVERRLRLQNLSS